MSEIKFINAAVDVVVRNFDTKKNAPPYICYDKNWQDIGRCHNFAGIDCELIFEEPFEATHNQAARPKTVYVRVNGTVQLDPEIPDRSDPLYVLVPSRRGMLAEPRQPIWCNGISAHTRVKIIGFYTGRYELTNREPLWIECDEIVGFNE